jgi:hypothetical protein
MLPPPKIQDKRPLPKIDELYKDVALVSHQNDLNRLLNCEPKKDWVRDHPFANNVKYIPIVVIEYLLTSIFVKWRVEIRSSKTIANSVVVEVRLHVQDPISGDWDWQDGIGAAPIQTEKGASPTAFDKVLNDAVMKAAPSAESYAVKDAAEKFGKIFGKDLNRRDFLAYTSLDGKLDTSNIQADSDMLAELRNMIPSTDLDNDEKDLLYEKFRGFFSVAEYETVKFMLQQHEVSPLTKVKNGETLKQSEINKAVEKAANVDVAEMYKEEHGGEFYKK